MAKISEKEFQAHFDSKITSEMDDFVTEHVFRERTYIFTWRKGKKQFGYCTYCHSTFQTSDDNGKNGLRHKAKTECTSCWTSCEARCAGISRKYMVDEAYFVYYQKSKIDPAAVVARGVYAIRDYHENFKNVRNGYADVAMYLFRPGLGRSGMYSRKVYFLLGSRNAFYSLEPEYQFEAYGYEAAARIHCKLYTLPWKCRGVYVDMESFAEAVKETTFENSGWEDHTGGDMLGFMQLAANYPCVEYLNKLGYQRLIYERLNHPANGNRLNWRGKSLERVLRITKSEAKLLRKNDVFVTHDLLDFHQDQKTQGIGFSILETAAVLESPGSYAINEWFNEYSKYGTVKRILKYLRRQCNRDTENIKGLTTANHMWKDYLRAATKLEFDLQDEKTYFPINLFNAHEKATAQAISFQNEKNDQMIAKRLKTLKKMEFHDDRYLIRPAQNVAEIVREGRILKHCVGTYIERYAKGSTVIFVLRQNSAPDKPFFTLEIRDGRITQQYGLSHCTPVGDVAEFVKAFEKAKLRKKAKKERVA